MPLKMPFSHRRPLVRELSRREHFQPPQRPQPPVQPEIHNYQVVREPAVQSGIHDNQVVGGSTAQPGIHDNRVVGGPTVQPRIHDNRVVGGPTVQPEEIRNLGELIRKRYELDIEIWGLRDVGLRDQPIVEDKMRKSDAILRKIQDTIDSWDSPAFKSAEDWEKIKEIKRRMKAEGIRIWADSPPWIDDRRADS